MNPPIGKAGRPSLAAYPCPKCGRPKTRRGGKGIGFTCKPCHRESEGAKYREKVGATTPVCKCGREKVRVQNPVGYRVWRCPECY